MTQNAQNITKAFDELKTGYHYSLVTLLLFAFITLLYPTYSILGPFSTLVIYVLMALPFAIMAVWSYSVFTRCKAWRRFGRKGTCLAMTLGWFVIFYFLFGVNMQVLPFSPSFSWQASRYLLVFCPPVFWAVYTLLEARSLRWLRDAYAIDLEKAWTCSLLGVAVYIATLLVYEFVFRYTVHFASTYYPFSHFTGTPSEPYLFALPFLFASCLLAKNALGKWQT